jgi:hypothetical protein
MADVYLLESSPTDRFLIEGTADHFLLAPPQTFSTTLGTATDTGSTTAPTNWTNARALTVTIPEVTTVGQDATVEIAQRNMTGTTGLIVFQEGSNNPAWWDDGTGAQDPLMTALVADGYRIIQVRGLTHYWMDAPSGQKAGSAILAKRATTLWKYLHDTYSGGLPFIVVGSSAGSSALGYALVHHDQDGIIDHAVHCASVPHADLYRGCARAIGDERYWSGSTQNADYIDVAHGYAGDGTGPCVMGSELVEGTLWNDTSLVNRPNSWYQWPTTRVDILDGSLDAFMAPGLLYRNQLVKAGQPHRFGQIPQVGHVIKDTDKGRQTILAAIRRRPYIGAWAEFATDTGPSLTATLDIAPAVGELLVAVRQWNGDATVGTTPTGWTRVAVATTTGASPRTVAIETKTADGTEGTALTFATTGTTVQSLAAAVVVNSMNPQLADTSSQTLTGTTMTLSAAAAQDNITFGAIAVEETGSNTFNQAWTNDFDQFSLGTSEVFSSAYAIHGTAGTKTTVETWVQSVAAAGITATFSAVGPYEVLTPTSRYY